MSTKPSRPDKIVRLTAEVYDHIHGLLINNLNEWQDTVDETLSFVAQTMVARAAAVLEAFENGTKKVEQGQ